MLPLGSRLALVSLGGYLHADAANTYAEISAKVSGCKRRFAVSAGNNVLIWCQGVTKAVESIGQNAQ